MTVDEAQKLGHGLYELTWKENGGTSLASVGSLADGTRWFAPINWISGPSTDWSKVESALHIADRDTVEELSYLRWFYAHADFGPADGDVREIMVKEYMQKTGKKIPDGYADYS